MIRQRIKNTLSITCDGIDFSTISNIEFYVSQGKHFFRQYTPTVVSGSEMVVAIPFEDAQELHAGNVVRLQFAFTDADGNARASDVVDISVGALLKEAGYAPV